MRSRVFNLLRQPRALLLTLLAIVITALLIPAERQIGANIRLVITHGAWVWTGLLTFGAAALAGLAALLLRRETLAHWSLALGRTGLFFWLTYLPMSLLLMQVTWGGLYFDEPRWRIPFTFAMVSVLLQAGLSLIGRPMLTALGNLLFGTALWVMLLPAGSVLHPESPVAQSESSRIQIFFILLLALSLLVAAQIAALLHSRQQART